MSSRTAILWLKIAIELQFILGAVMVLVGIPFVGGLFAVLVNLVVDPGSPVVPLATEARLLSAIGGGVLIGWAYFAWHITTHEIEAGDPAGARAFLIALMLWFFADSGGSILAGAPLNAAFNLLYLVLFLPPLIALMRGTTAPARA